MALIPPISLIIAIILGINGNEWAWKNRKFENVEQFKEVQKKWAIAGTILCLVAILILAIMVAVNVHGARIKANNAAQKSNITSMYKTIPEVYEKVTKHLRLR